MQLQRPVVAPHISPAILPAYSEYREIDEWRSITLMQVMKIAIPLAMLAGIPYIYFAIVRGPSLITAAYVPPAIAVFMSAAMRRSFRVSALCLLAVPYWLGLSSMFMRGTMSLLYMLTFVIGVVILMGPSFAYGAVALCALTLLVGGQYTHWQPTLAGIDSDRITTWAVIAFNFSCVALILVVGCRNLLRKMELSLKAQKIAAHSVDLRQEEISRLKREIRNLKRAQAS